jgi:hypothetical protein
MTDLFYWKEIERRARAAHALAMLHNNTDTDGINQANAIFDELCLDRMGAERLIRSRMPRRRHSSRLAALALRIGLSCTKENADLRADGRAA